MAVPWVEGLLFVLERDSSSADLGSCLLPSSTPCLAAYSTEMREGSGEDTPPIVLITCAQSSNLLRSSRLFRLESLNLPFLLSNAPIPLLNLLLQLFNLLLLLLDKIFLFSHVLDETSVPGLVSTWLQQAEYSLKSIVIGIVIFLGSEVNGAVSMQDSVCSCITGSSRIRRT